MQPSPRLNALLHNWFYGNFGVRITGALIYAFLIASIPLNDVVRWLFAGLDPRTQRLASTAVPVLNALKGFIATIIAFHGGGQVVGFEAGFAAIIGHCFSPWRRFRATNGVDALIGILLACNTITGVIVLAVWIVSALVTRSQRTASIVAASSLFIPLWFISGAPGLFFGLAAGAATLFTAAELQ